MNQTIWFLHFDIGFDLWNLFLKFQNMEILFFYKTNKCMFLNKKKRLYIRVDENCFFYVGAWGEGRTCQTYSQSHKLEVTKVTWQSGGDRSHFLSSWTSHFSPFPSLIPHLLPKNLFFYVARPKTKVIWYFNLGVCILWLLFLVMGESKSHPLLPPHPHPLAPKGKNSTCTPHN